MINAQQGGLGALQPTPQQQLGSMVGAPSARLGAPKSPQQAAAEQIVESEVPKELEALIKERKALELLASAQRDKQAQQPVQPQTVKSQVEGGIASMMDRLRPGMAQRGRQVQVARNRQMMGLPAAGMPRMASGGVVGFQDRGFVDVDEIAEEYNLTPEGVDRLLNLDELSEERQEVEVEAPRERPRTAAERRAGPLPGDALVEYVKENPLQAASIAALLPFGGGLAMGAGRLGLGALGRFAPRAGSTLSKLFTRPNPNVVRGPGFTMRPPGQRLRTFSPTRTGTTLGVAGLLADQAMRGGGDEVSAEEVAVAPAPREPTPQEKLGSMVGRPTAMFKAGEARQPEERGLMSRIGSALTSDRARAIADALGKLSYAGGATEGYMGQRLQEGLRAERLAEQKRQDELNALEEMRKLEREKFASSAAATIGAANIRAQAAREQAIAEKIADYPTTDGYQIALTGKAEELGLDRTDPKVREEVLKDYTNYVYRSYGQDSTGLGSMPGLSAEDLALIEQYAPQSN